MEIYNNRLSVCNNEQLGSEVVVALYLGLPVLLLDLAHLHLLAELGQAVTENCISPPEGLLTLR